MNRHTLQQLDDFLGLSIGANMIGHGLLHHNLATDRQIKQANSKRHHFPEKPIRIHSNVHSQRHVHGARDDL